MKKAIFFIAFLLPTFASFLFAQTPDNVNTSEYGTGKSSYGIAYGAPGVLGIPVRFYPNEKTALQIGPYLSGAPVYTVLDELEVKTGFALAGSVTFFGDKSYKSPKEKIKRHGFTLKAGHQFGDFSTTYVAGGWAVETFKKRNKNRSFIFELGLGGYIPHWENIDAYYYQDPKFTPTAMIDFKWQWYGKKSRTNQLPGMGTNAQLPRDTTLKGRYVGLSMGLGWSKQKINYEFAFDDYQSARVFTFGLLYGQPVSEKLGWQIELNLTQHGYREEQISNSGGVKIKAKADARIRYIEVPFLLAYRFPVGGKGFEINAMPGVSLGYAISGKIVAHGEGENETRKVEIKITDKISFKDTKSGDRLDAALLIGARGVYPVGRTGKAFVEARYHFGVLNLERNEEFIITEEGDKAFNRSVLLRVGYMYSL